MCSNRTFMELKFNNGSIFLNLLECSNRTFMELKYGNCCASWLSILRVLIVPLWN